MNNKLIAILMAAVMMIAAMVIGTSNSAQGDEAGDSPTNPVWLVGSENGYYLVKEGDTIAYPAKDATSTPIYPQININESAFDNAVVSIGVAQLADIKVVQDTEFVTLFGADAADDDGIDAVDITITKDKDGKYSVQIEAVEAEDEPVAYYYLFQVSVTRTGGNFADLTQPIYYAAYIKVLDENTVINGDDPDSRSVFLSNVGDDRSTYIPYNNGNTDADADTTYLKIVQDEVVDAYVFVQLVADSTGGAADGEYIWADYDFYAVGLPLGVAMKLDGEISGKVAASVSTNSTPKDFTVFAVDKNSGHGIYSGEFKYCVLPADDSFQYIIDDENADEPVSYSWATPGYKVVKNDEEFTVTVQNPDGTAATDDISVWISLDDNDLKNIDEVEGATFEDGVITIGDKVLNDYTGIIQIQIVKATDTANYTAIIHVLVVGPVVHSGLMPAVTSN